MAVLIVKPTEMAAAHSYTGVVRARYETDLGFRVAGKVAARFVEVGQRVAAGQTIATQARFAIPDDVPGVELGMTPTIHLTAGPGGPAFVLPASALVRQGSRGSVWVVGEGGKLTRTPVTVPRYGQDEVVVSGVLRGGERVVRAGVNRLHAGLVVRPTGGK